MIFLQRTFTSLVHAHAGRTQIAARGQFKAALVLRKKPQKRATLNLLGLYSPLLAAFKKYCDEIFDYGQFVLIPRPLAAGMFILPVSKALAQHKKRRENYRSVQNKVILRQARESSGLTQEEIAKMLNTKKSAISRIENHAEDIKLSTLEKFASVLGRKVEVSIR